MPSKKKFELTMPPDEAPMREAVHTLQQLGHAVKRTSEHQLKIDDVNFWPATGRIHVDGEDKQKLKGLRNLLALLEKRAGVNLADAQKVTVVEL